MTRGPSSGGRSASVRSGCDIVCDQLPYCLTVSSEAVVIHRSGNDVVVFGAPSAVERLGERIADVPGPIVRAARHAVVLAGEAAEQVAEMTGAYLKLTPDAQRLLAAHDQAATSGGMLGWVRSSDGKIAGQLTFEPGGVISAAPALAGAAALQLQMAAIEKRLDAIQSDLGYLIKQRHIDVEAEVATNLEILSSVYGEVMASGELSSTQWDRIANIEASVRRVFHQSSMHLGSIRQALDGASGTLGERVGSLRQLLNQDRAEQWLHVHVHADRAMTQWELLHLYRQLDEEPDRIDELAAGVKKRTVERFDVLRELAGTLAELLVADLDDRWYDAFRLISRKRLDDLLVELAQLLYSYRQGVTEVNASNVLAMAEADVACDGLGALAVLPVEGEELVADGDAGGMRRAISEAVDGALSKLPLRGDK